MFQNKLRDCAGFAVHRVSCIMNLVSKTPLWKSLGVDMVDVYKSSGNLLLICSLAINMDFSYLANTDNDESDVINTASPVASVDAITLMFLDTLIDDLKKGDSLEKAIPEAVRKVGEVSSILHAKLMLDHACNIDVLGRETKDTGILLKTSMTTSSVRDSFDTSIGDSAVKLAGLKAIHEGNSPLEIAMLRVRLADTIDKFLDKMDRSFADEDKFLELIEAIMEEKLVKGADREVTESSDFCAYFLYDLYSKLRDELADEEDEIGGSVNGILFSVIIAATNDLELAFFLRCLRFAKDVAKQTHACQLELAREKFTNEECSGEMASSFAGLFENIDEFFKVESNGEFTTFGPVRAKEFFADMAHKLFGNINKRTFMNSRHAAVYMRGANLSKYTGRISDVETITSKSPDDTFTKLSAEHFYHKAITVKDELNIMDHAQVRDAYYDELGFTNIEDNISAGLGGLLGKLFGALKDAASNKDDSNNEEEQPQEPAKKTNKKIFN